MSEIHSTAAHGFDRGAQAYARARPSYPPEAVDHALGAIGSGGLVLDLAAGTGKFTELLVARGVRCVAVEPVEGMRRAFAEALPAVEILDGTAEAIPLGDASVDAIVAAQALHWFDLERALPEMARVLRPGGRLALVWNARDERSAWVKRITEMIDPYEGDVRIHRYRRGRWRDPMWSSPLYRFVSEAEFDHEQEMDEDALVERIASTSFVAVLPDDERARLLDGIRDLARTHPDLAGRERFGFPYVCEVYVFERVAA